MGTRTTLGLKPALDGLRRELARDLEQVRGLTAVEQHGARIDELTEDLDRQLERVQEAAVVTLCGATGAGKSSLLNALVGRDVAREGEDRPTTSAPVIYRPRDADLADLVEGLPGETPEIVDYDPGGEGRWQGQILVDSPDVNSVQAAHREVVGALADRSDVLLVVAHRQSIQELASVAFVDAFAGRRGMLFVLNRSDELTDDARDELLGQLRGLAAGRWDAPDAPLLAISARRAKDDPDEPGWAELLEALQTLVRAGRLGRVRRHNALGTAGRMAALFEELSASGLAQDLEAYERALGTGIAAWRARLEAALSERLELRRADLRASLWNEVARRWDGPGGWALRAGGLSALGLGAGAALARRNPALAAGAALGGLAAERVKEGVRERGLRDASGLLPGPLELEAVYRAELAEVRLAAGRLARDPETCGLPRGEDLARGAASAVDEAWARLLDRDLLAASEVGGRLAVRLPVDLPVYALAGWTVYRAALGFYRGDYVGLDFLLNAGIVLLAWLWLARTVVRWLLGGRVRGLVVATRAFAGEALGDVAADARDRARSAAAERRAALERLGALERRWRARLGTG